jgi:uncharacterized membrane protein
MSPIYVGATLLAALLGSGLVTMLFRSRAMNKRDFAEADERSATSAEVLARAYATLVDDLRKDSDRQDREIKELRAELASVRDTRDRELAALRLELASERRENGQLRERVAALEAEVRRDRA